MVASQLPLLSHLSSPSTSKLNSCFTVRRSQSGHSGCSSVVAGGARDHRIRPFLHCSHFNKGLSWRGKRSHVPDERGEQVVVHVKDPDVAGVSEDDDSPDKYPPNIFWRVVAASTYIIPWIDAVGLGREIYHKFPSFILLYFMTGPFVGIYYSSPFAPILIFFLMFLAIVKNSKLSHFVRFNCMQAIMLDIVVMLFTILHSYFPAELRWSWVLSTFDQYSWVASMGTVLFCVFFTLMGKYADLPFVSEAVYIQVEMSDYA